MFFCFPAFRWTFLGIPNREMLLLLSPAHAMGLAHPFHRSSSPTGLPIRPCPPRPLCIQADRAKEVGIPKREVQRMKYTAFEVWEDRPQRWEQRTFRKHAAFGFVAFRCAAPPEPTRQVQCSTVQYSTVQYIEAQYTCTAAGLLRVSMAMQCSGMYKCTTVQVCVCCGAVRTGCPRAWWWWMGWGTSCRGDRRIQECAWVSDSGHRAQGTLTLETMEEHHRFLVRQPPKIQTIV